jgi:hypothetical protein
MRKITEMGYRPHEINNSNYEVNNNQNHNINLDGNHYKPPMPLPHSHNDWTHIK